jgi:hypothetical protein
MNKKAYVTPKIAAHVLRSEVLSLRHGVWLPWLRGTDGVLATVEPIVHHPTSLGLFASDEDGRGGIYRWCVLGTHMSFGVARTEHEAREAAERHLRTCMLLDGLGL